MKISDIPATGPDSWRGRDKGAVFRIIAGVVYIGRNLELAKAYHGRYIAGMVAIGGRQGYATAERIFTTSELRPMNGAAKALLAEIEGASQ